MPYPMTTSRMPPDGDQVHRRRDPGPARQPGKRQQAAPKISRTNAASKAKSTPHLSRAPEEEHGDGDPSRHDALGGAGTHIIQAGVLAEVHPQVQQDAEIAEPFEQVGQVDAPQRSRSTHQVDDGLSDLRAAALSSAPRQQVLRSWTDVPLSGRQRGGANHTLDRDGRITVAGSAPRGYWHTETRTMRGAEK